MTHPIGFIGVGSMGGPVATHLVRNGHALLVHDVDPAAVGRLIEAGAQPGTSPGDLATRCETVFLCLPTLDALSEVVRQLRAGGALRTCVNLSTAGPRFIGELEAMLAPAGVTLLDCPITGGTAGAKEGTLSITVSGDKSAYESLKPLLDAIARHVFYVGAKPGQAQLLKLLNNMLSFAAFVSTCEAFAMGVKAGLDPDAMVDVINTGTGRNSATTDKFPKNILPRTFDYGARLAISFKDISLCLEEAQRLGVPMWVAPAVRQVIAFAVTQDGDANDVTTLVRHYEKWSGVEIVGAAARGDNGAS